MTKKISKTIYFGITFVFLTFLNFYISELIVSRLSLGWHFSNSIFEFVYVENTGAAFSIFANSTNNLIIVSAIIILSIFAYIVKNIKTSRMIEIFFLSFLASGVFGNLLERIALGYVRDFFNLTFVTFPIFNISDIFINIGVWGIIFLILSSKKPTEQR